MMPIDFCCSAVIAKINLRSTGKLPGQMGKTGAAWQLSGSAFLNVKPAAAHTCKHLLSHRGLTDFVCLFFSWLITAHKRWTYYLQL